MKRLFYYTDICMLLSKEEKGFEKIRRCLDIFEENRDSLTIVWGLPASQRKDLALLNPNVAEGFDTLLDDFRKRGLGEIIETEDLLTVLTGCDAYYGDASELTYYANKDHIPVMIADVEL